MPIKKIKQNGFTITELLLVMGIFAVLSVLATITLLRPQIKSSVDKNVNTMIADIKLQQIKAMIGDTQNVGGAEDYGVYFENTSYTLFKGSAYNSSDTNNIVIELDQAIEFSRVNLPNSQIVFERLSGEINNFDSGQNDITVQHDQGGLSTEVNFNEYGAYAIN